MLTRTIVEMVTFNNPFKVPGVNKLIAAGTSGLLRRPVRVWPKSVDLGPDRLWGFYRRFDGISVKKWRCWGVRILAKNRQ